MIARLSGVVEEMAVEGAVIDVHGVGYLVFCSTRTLGQLPQKGVPVRLLVETHVREDHIHLYGFIDAAEREWFRLLLTVQGVGARLALSMLSALTPDRLRLALLAGDKSALCAAEGVGPRLAARIVNELKEKAGGVATPVATAGAAVSILPSGPIDDAVSALENLNIPRSEAYGAIAAAARRLGEGAGLDALIKTGLQELGR